jgi:hypothetical protein
MPTRTLLGMTTALGAVLMLAACGGSSTAPARCASQGSCRKEYTCLDYGGFGATDLAGLKGSCIAGDHLWSDAACDQAASIGRCDFARDGTCETQWIFAGPLPESERRLSCASAGGVWRTSSGP